METKRNRRAAKIERSGRERRQKEEEKRQADWHGAPNRIRSAAGTCKVFGWIAVAGGIGLAVDSPAFGGDAYTEIVSQLATGNGGIAWLAAVLLFVASALLRALGDILSEMRDNRGTEPQGDPASGGSQPATIRRAARQPN